MPSEITFAQFGGPEVLQWTPDAEMPEPLPSQIVIVVLAASANSFDAHVRRGHLIGSIATFLPSGTGFEAAGIVIARGRAVRDVELGDEVFGFTDTGAYAQFAALTTYARKPDGMSWSTAASISNASATAYRVLDELDLAEGQTLVITGGAGAVGSFAVQIAVSRGIRVIATVSADDEAYVRSLGALPVRYGDGCSDRIRAISPRGADGAFDTAGVRVLSELVTLTGSPTRVVTISDPTAANYGVRLSNSTAQNRSKQQLRDVAGLVRSGDLTVRISRTYPMRDAAQAHRELEAGQVHGRVVLTNAT
jgi:NADPH:quinone reductase-like Zn-dependent oxidoreductase